MIGKLSVGLFRVHPSGNNNVDTIRPQRTLIVVVEFSQQEVEAILRR